MKFKIERYEGCAMGRKSNYVIWEVYIDNKLSGVLNRKKDAEKYIRYIKEGKIDSLGDAEMAMRQYDNIHGI